MRSDINRPKSADNTKIIAALIGLKDRIPELTLGQLTSIVQESVPGFVLTPIVVKRRLQALGLKPKTNAKKSAGAKRGVVLLNMVRSLESRFKEIEMRLASIESDLGIKKG